MLGLMLISLLIASDEPKTLMTERGKLVFSDDLAQPLNKEWVTAKGKWEVVDGAIKGSELKSDMHGAVTRHKIAFKDAVIAYSFKLDGAKMTTLSINAKGHLCRVLINPTSITIQKDDSDHAGPDTKSVLETRKVAINPGEWHSIVLELRGKEMVATLDGQHTLVGTHDALDVEKVDFGFTVAGESVSFKNVRVWEAQPNKDWEATKAKLAASQPKK